MSRQQFILGLTVYAMSLLLGGVIGMFSGHPLDPDGARERIEELNKFEREFPGMTPQERQELWKASAARYPQDRPHSLPRAFAAALEWHPYFPAVACAVILLALRPRRRELAFALVAISGLLFILVGWRTVLAVVVPTSAYFFLFMFRDSVKSKSPRSS